MPPELKRFRDVVSGDGGDALEVGKGPSDTQDAIVPSSGETEPLHCVAQEPRPAGIRSRHLADDPGGQVGIQGDPRPALPVGLPVPRRLDAGGDRVAHLTGRPHHFLIGDRCDLDLDVHAVEEGAGDPRLVATHRRRRARAGRMSP